jgi:uncharacterized protein (DUF1697 family)
MIQVALLRAINVAGRQPVTMADLRNVLAGLGLHDPQSVLQSGNLVFDAGKQAGATLERLIEHELAKRRGLQTDVMVRSAAEWASIIARNPFQNEAAHDPARLVVVFLKSKPTADAFDALRDAVVGPEILHGEGRQAYIVYPDGIGRSRLTAALIERKLATRGTARNWNTVIKLGALAASRGSRGR